MLKIKKNYALSILKNYEFQKGYELFADNTFKFAVMVSPDGYILFGLNREVWYSKDYYYSTNEDVIYDLIKDGIVEKE